MRHCILLCLFILSININAQLDYTETGYDLLGVSDFDDYLYLGNGEAVVLSDGTPYQISFDSEYNFSIKYIENVNINQDLLARYDVNRDGLVDLLTADKNKTALFTFLNTEQGFDDVNNLFNVKVNAFHTQDFDGDGTDELFINGYIYKYNLDGSLEQLYSRTPGNADYVFKSPYMMDVNEDGLQDVMVQLLTNLGYLRNVGEGELRLNLFNELNHQCRWMKTITTENGPVVIYYDYDNSIYKLSFDDGQVSKTKLVNSQPNYGFEVISTDLNQDGNEELVIFSAPANYYYLLDYDLENDTAEYRRIDVNGPEGILYIDDTETPKLIGLSPGEANVYEADADLIISLIKTSKNSTQVYDNSFIDVNGDGYTDIYNSNFIRNYYGGSEFSNLMDFSLPSTGGVLEDFDGDGDADYVTDEYWFENLGNLTFGTEQPNPNYSPYPDPDVFFTSVVYEDDLDQDGDIDLLTYNIFGEPLELLINNTNQYFEDPIRLADSDFISGKIIELGTFDMNADGTKDIVLATVSGVAWWPQSADHTFGDGIAIYNGNLSPRGIDIKDGNGDGYIDMDVGTGELLAGTPIGNISLYRGTENGPVLVGSTEEENGYKYPTFIDYNNDGADDILISDSNSLWLNIFSSYDSMSTSLGLVKGAFSEYGSYEVQDVDGDSDDDIIIYEDEGIKMKFLLKGESINTNSCPLNNVRLHSQSQVELYANRFGSCEVVDGDLYIGGNTDWADISSISSLANIKQINGSLSMRFMNKLDNYSSLDNLDTIHGDFFIQLLRPSSFNMFNGLKYVSGNFIIDNVTAPFGSAQAWSNLSYVGKDLSVSRTSLSSLENLIYSNKINGSFEWSDDYGELTDLSSLNQLDTVIGLLKIETDNFENFNYIDNLKYAGGLIISGSNFQRIDISAVQDSMPFGLGLYTRTENGVINQNLNLKTVGNGFAVRGRDIGSWPELEYVENYFNISSQELDDASFNKLKSVNSFSTFIGNKDDYSNFPSLEKIRNTFSVAKNIASLNGLASLDSIIGDFYLSYNPILTNINGLNDDLYVDGTWTMFYNENLNYCESVALCKHLEAGGDYQINNNAANCDNISDIQCLTNSITGFTFYDYNENGIYEETTEALLSDFELRFDNEPTSTITGNNGFYRKHLLPGQAARIESYSKPEFSFTTPNFYHIDSFIPDMSSLEDFDFGFISNQEELRYTTAINSSLFICNREFLVSSKVTNTSAAVGHGFVLVTYSSELTLDSEFTEYTEHDEENRTIKIDFEELFPYFHIDIDIPFLAPSAEELFNTDHYVKFEIFQKDDLVFTEVHEDILPLGLLCSYDPNDKLVSSTDRTGNIRVNEVEDEIIYTIRFQNTGNFYAEDVRLTDQISENLDLSSFRFIDASHEVEISLRNRELTFMFEDIFLTDSTTSFIESQGFVSFGIQPLSYDLDTEFENQANIYFDFNAPIITNLAESIVYDPTVDIEETLLDKLYLYPIPTSQYLHIEADNIGIKNYEIVDVLGNTILSGNLKTSSPVVNIESLVAGNYVIRLIANEDQVWNKVFVVGN